MPEPADKALYARIKAKADKIYEKSSAYKSGYIVKTYKAEGGKYLDDDKPKNLKRWYEEKWKNVGDKDDYPTYRPTKKVSSKTPLTPSEIKPANLKKQIALKQKIKGKKNLPPFEKK